MSNEINDCRIAIKNEYSPMKQSDILQIVLL